MNSTVTLAPAAVTDYEDILAELHQLTRDHLLY